MLQTRFENEQFNSLPLVFNNHRTRNDYITTDRPDSAQVLTRMNFFPSLQFILFNINSSLTYIYILYQNQSGEMVNILYRMKQWMTRYPLVLFGRDIDFYLEVF